MKNHGDGDRSREAQYRASVSYKGQIVIPAELRRRYGISEGTAIVFQDVGGGILLSPQTTAAIRQLRGIAFRPGIPIDPERDHDLR